MLPDMSIRRLTPQAQPCKATGAQGLYLSARANGRLCWQPGSGPLLTPLRRPDTDLAGPDCPAGRPVAFPRTSRLEMEAI